MMPDFGNKLMNRFFRKVDDAVWDLTSGNMGIRTDDGIASLTKDVDGNYSISLNIFDQMSIAIPAFAQNTKTEDIKIGDLIYTDKKVLGWIIETGVGKNNSFRILKKDGQSGTWTPPKVSMMGIADAGGALVLRSLINTLPGGEGGLEGFKNNLLPMMFMMGDNGDNSMMEKMIPMMLMTNGTGGGMGNMMQTMMMMFMMSGNAGANPLTSMFGGNKSGVNHFDREGRRS
jgi:hypothetical protein